MKYFLNFLLFSEKGKDREFERYDNLIFAVFPVFVTFILSLIQPFILRMVIEEKEGDMKGLLTIMGRKKSVYWYGSQFSFGS